MYLLVKSVFLYAAQCQKIKKDNERRILSAEIRWLPKIVGLSNSERRNEDKNWNKKKHWRT